MGASVGDSLGNLVNAVRALGALPGVRLRGVSRLYRTKHVGGIDKQDFINAVVEMDVQVGTDQE